MEDAPPGALRAALRSIVPERVRRALLAQAAGARRSELLENDPAQFAHAYRDPLDQEIVGLLGAFLAFGNVRAFLPKIAALLGSIGPSPRAFVRSFRRSRDGRILEGFRSRVHTGEDLGLLFGNLRRILREHATLEDAFLAGERVDGAGGDPGPGGGGPEPGGSPGRPESRATRHRERLAAFAALFYRWGRARGRAGGPSAFPPGYRHLVADPRRGSACKRWNLFLRWMVRPADGVDLGLWTRVDPRDLVIPLDVHVGRIGGLLGLRKRRTLDWKAAEEITAGLRTIDPGDPLRFDFPLSHLGISAGCRGRWAETACPRCAIREVCEVGCGRRERGRGASGPDGPPGAQPAEHVAEHLPAHLTAQPVSHKAFARRDL